MVMPPLSMVTSPGGATATVGVPFSFQIMATNSPTGFDAMVLPPNLALNKQTGLISGTPTQAGQTDLIISVTNSGGTTMTPFSIFAFVPPVITSPLAIDTFENEPFSYVLTANTAAVFNAAPLPQGVAFSGETNTISGTLATPGVYNIPIAAANPGGMDNKTLTVSNRSRAIPVITEFSSDDDPGFLGSPVTYTFSASDSDSPMLQYRIDFGDGFPAITGSFAADTFVAIGHTYTVPGDYVATLTVTGGLQSATAMTDESIPAPGSGSDGVKNVSDNVDEVDDPDDNIGIALCASNGGVIRLCIDPDTTDGRSRASTDLTTDWGDISGRTSKSAGSRPVHQFIHHGIFVAKVSETTHGTNQNVGIARRMIAVGSNETGERTPHALKPAFAQRSAAAKRFSASRLRGRLSFGRASIDTVSLLGSITLPAGFNVGAQHELQIGIGNVTGSINLNEKGSGMLPGSPALYKKVKIFFPGIKGGILPADQQVRVDVLLAAQGLSAAGFDTSGISNKHPGSSGLLRQIQVALVLDGIAYETLVPVLLDVSSDAAHGSFDLAK